MTARPLKRSLPRGPGLIEGLTYLRQLSVYRTWILWPRVQAGVRVEICIARQKRTVRYSVSYEL